MVLTFNRNYKHKREHRKKVLKIYDQIQRDPKFDLDAHIILNRDIDDTNLHQEEFKYLNRYCSRTYLGVPENDECIICFAEYEMHDKLTRFPMCGHKYHKECLALWMKKENTCPMCRRKVRSALLYEIQKQFKYAMDIELKELEDSGMLFG